MTDFEDIIDTRDLAELIESKACRVIDCRFNLMQPEQGRADYKASHIPGALYADLDCDLAAEKSADSGRHPLPEPDKLVARLKAWGIGNDSQVIVYDDASGALAARMWWLLKWLGHRRVAVLDGGFNAWVNDGLPVQTGIAKIIPAEFSARVNAAMVATTEEIAELVDGGGKLYLFDARDRARFVGEVEPIDSVAGHVPGAINLPFSTHLGEDGCWQCAEALAESWNAVLGEVDVDQAIVMCGSGVTACHLALSARLAGLGMPRVYIGSWSEWISDSSRPVATGVAP